MSLGGWYHQRQIDAIWNDGVDFGTGKARGIAEQEEHARSETENSKAPARSVCGDCKRDVGGCGCARGAAFKLE